MELLCRHLRLRGKVFQRNPDPESVVAYRLEPRHTCSDRHQALKLALQHIRTLHVLGLVLQLVDGIVCAQRAVDEFFAIWPDGNGIEEGRGSGCGAASLPYRCRVKKVRVVALWGAIAGQADGVASLLARRTDKADRLACIKRRVALDLHLARRLDVFEKCVLLEAMLSKDLLDSALKLAGVESALELALNVDPVALLLKHLVRE